MQQIIPTDLFKGSRELLDELRNHGIKTAVGSANNNIALVVQKLQILDLVDAVADGTEVLHSKPAPDVFQLCAKKLNVTCPEWIVLEGARAGIRAAVVAGMTAVVIGRSELLPEADWVVQLVRDLKMNLLRRLVLENRRLIMEGR